MHGGLLLKTSRITSNRQRILQIILIRNKVGAHCLCDSPTSHPPSHACRSYLIYPFFVIQHNNNNTYI